MRTVIFIIMLIMIIIIFGGGLMNLDEAKKGQLIKVTRIKDDLTRMQAIRLGIAEGAVVTCREIVPAGPVVVARNKQEIAIGRNLARTISVEPY